MANLSITLKTQSVSVFGPSPSQLWNGFSWGSGTWGQKAAGSAGTPQILKRVTRAMAAQPVNLTETPSFRTVKYLSAQTISFVTHNIVSMSFRDGKGYLYVFPGPSADAESHPVPTYSSVTSGVSGWTLVAAASTSWS